MLKTLIAIAALLLTPTGSPDGCTWVGGIAFPVGWFTATNKVPQDTLYYDEPYHLRMIVTTAGVDYCDLQSGQIEFFLNGEPIGKRLRTQQFGAGTLNWYPVSDSFSISPPDSALTETWVVVSWSAELISTANSSDVGPLVGSTAVLVRPRPGNEGRKGND